jgi:hypothetical protein
LVLGVLAALLVTALALLATAVIRLDALKQYTPPGGVDVSEQIVAARARSG